MLALLPPLGPRSSSASSSLLGSSPSLILTRTRSSNRTHSRIERNTYTCNTYLTQIHVLHGSNVLFSFPFPSSFSLGHASTPFHRPLLSLSSFCTASGTGLFIFLSFSLPLARPYTLRPRSSRGQKKGKRRGEGGGVCFLPTFPRRSLLFPSTTVRHRAASHQGSCLPLSPCHDAKVSNCSSDSQINVSPTPCFPTLRPRSLHSANSARVHR